MIPAVRHYWLLVVLLTLSPGCFSPRFEDGKIACQESPDCPLGFDCIKPANLCYRKSSDMAGQLANDTRVCRVDGDCPSGDYCSLVGTCFGRGTAPARCPSFAVFCDDFEGRATIPWSAQVNGGTTAPSGASVVVDTTQPYPSHEQTGFKSQHSLHVIAPGTTMAATYWQRWPLLLPTPVAAGATPTTIAMRGYIYSPTVLQQQPYFFYLHSNLSEDGYNIGAINGSIDTNANWSLFNKQSQNFAFDSAAPALASGQWYCAELTVTLQLAAGTLSNLTDFYVDGMLLSHIAVTDGDATSSIGEFDIGNAWAQSTLQNEYFLDDVVMARQRIFCE